jgi:hypothetical protein
MSAPKYSPLARVPLARGYAKLRSGRRTIEMACRPERSVPVTSHDDQLQQAR